MNLTELRTVVRSQTQTTIGDLPDPTVDSFLQQAFERTINGETQWPFYEKSWELVLDIGQSTLSLPGDVNPVGVMALYDTVNNFRLTQIAVEFGDDHYIGPFSATACPVQYSLWGGEVLLWPRVLDPAAQRVYRLRGYRRAITWLNDAQEPDCDSRLHFCLTHYAVALAYVQQEDEQLESVYMDRWQRDAEMARRAIMEPRHHRPLVMAGSIDTVPAGGPGWTLTPP